MTAERYTAIFTGLFDLKKPGEYPYLVMDGAGGNAGPRKGRPPAGRLRTEVSLGDLPDGARRRVLEAYRQMWGL